MPACERLRPRGINGFALVVSELMPDVFAGVMFLCAYLLVYASELRLARRILLATILTFSIAAHSSLFPIAALYFSALVTVRIWARRSLDSVRNGPLWHGYLCPSSLQASQPRVLIRVWQRDLRCPLRGMSS